MPAGRTITRFTGPKGLLGLACVAVVALTAGCGLSSTGSASPAYPSASATDSMRSAMPESMSSAMPGSPSTPSAASHVMITIKDFAFDVPASVSAGATITVVNNDTMSHTVTSTEKGAFDLTVAGGATGTFTAPAKAGTYDFVCSFHGNMKAKLTVS